MAGEISSVSCSIFWHSDILNANEGVVLHRRSKSVVNGLDVFVDLLEWRGGVLGPPD